MRTYPDRPRLITELARGAVLAQACGIDGVPEGSIAGRRQTSADCARCRGLRRVGLGGRRWCFGASILRH